MIYLASDNPTECRMDALVEHARMIVAGQVPVNDHDRFDDWFEFTAIPSVPSLN